MNPAAASPPLAGEPGPAHPAHPALAGLALAPGWQVLDDADDAEDADKGPAVLLQAPAPAGAAAFAARPLGRFRQLDRFTSLQRWSPFWTRPVAGTREEQLRPETLWLLARHTDGSLSLLVPLLDGDTRHALAPVDGQLGVHSETGDPALPLPASRALWLGRGTCPYALCARAARAVLRVSGAGALRVDKPVPDVADLFGWCTWDAFYKDVSPAGIREGLASLTAAGAPPGLLILDDGWQTWQPSPRGAAGEDRLLSLGANARFGHDLGALVDEAKTRWGVQRVLAWHALLGYWGGLHDAAFAELGVRTVPRRFGPGILAQTPGWDTQPWGDRIGVPARAQVAAFFDQLHAGLAAQGIDGVKVDAQALLEAVAAGQGGRVGLARTVRAALDASAARHFQGRLINCMASTQECAYLAAGSTLMRSSDDFLPDAAGSHGWHLRVNAMASLWFGEFMLPDWDMFQSGHAMGAFHAAARAISGGPVYVSDRVGVHDGALLRRLVLRNGQVLRCDGPARPCPDSLFDDPEHPQGLLKIFNRNGLAAVVGAFHTGPGIEPLPLAVRAADVPGLDGSLPHHAWAWRHDRMWRLDPPDGPDGPDGPDAAPALHLGPGDWELVHLAPVVHGLALFGLAGQLNSSAALGPVQWPSPACCRVPLREGGELLAWAACAPQAAQVDGQPVPWRHDPADGRLRVQVPTAGPCVLRLQWAVDDAAVPTPTPDTANGAPDGRA